MDSKKIETSQLARLAAATLSVGCEMSRKQGTNNVRVMHFERQFTSDPRSGCRCSITVNTRGCVDKENGVLTFTARSLYGISSLAIQCINAVFEQCKLPQIRAVKGGHTLNGKPIDLTLSHTINLN